MKLLSEVCGYEEKSMNVIARNAVEEYLGHHMSVASDEGRLLLQIIKNALAEHGRNVEMAEIRKYGELDRNRLTLALQRILSVGEK